MYNVLETVDGCDLAFASFVVAADHEDFVVFADGNGSDLWLGVLVMMGEGGG